MSNSRSRSIKDIAKKQKEYVDNERQMMKMNANNAQKDNRDEKVANARAIQLVSSRKLNIPRTSRENSVESTIRIQTHSVNLGQNSTPTDSGNSTILSSLAIGPVPSVFDTQPTPPAAEHQPSSSGVHVNRSPPTGNNNEGNTAMEEDSASGSFRLHELPDISTIAFDSDDDDPFASLLRIADSFYTRDEWSPVQKERIKELFVCMARKKKVETAPKSIIKKWINEKDKFLEFDLGKTITAIHHQLISIHHQIKAGLYNFDFSNDPYMLIWDPVNTCYRVLRK